MSRIIAFLLPLIAITSIAFAEDRKPNVVFILTDDQGALDAGCYGSADLKTPAIDRLAKEGVRFTNAYAHSVCCPARAMLLTGRHPQRSDVGSWVQSKTTPESTGRNLRLQEKTIAETFADAGYRTALFGKWHLGAAETHGPLKQGFHRFFGIRGGFIDNYVHFHLHDRGRHDLYRGTEELFRRGEYFMDIVLAETNQFLTEATAADQPFFLYFPLNLPHYPEQALKQHGKLFDDLPEPRRAYARVMATTDHYIGKVLNKLDELKQADNTIVVYASDNGYSREDYQVSVDDHASGIAKGTDYGPHGGGGNVGKWRGSKGSFLEGGLRVPTIIRFPKSIEPGTVCDATVTLMDWYPTVVELAGAKYDGPKLDGQSVVPVIGGAKSNHYDEMHWAWQKTWAVRKGDWKLIHKGNLGLTGRGNNQWDNKMPKVFLGRVTDANPELKNYADEKPEIVSELTKLHETWAKDVEPEH